MKKSATIQLVILFFSPYILASINTIMGAKMLQGIIKLSLLSEVTVVLMIFGGIECLFFLLIRSFYIKKLFQYSEQ